MGFYPRFSFQKITSKCLNFVFKDQTPNFILFSKFMQLSFLTQNVKDTRNKKQERDKNKNKNANNRTQDANKNKTRYKQKRK